MSATKSGSRVLAQQVRRHAHGARGIGDIDGLAAAVIGIDLDRRMHAAGRGAADQQRNVEALALHLGWRHGTISSSDGVIRPDRPMMLRLVLARRIENFLRRRHHAQIDHFIAVALQHHADDVLADVVHIALHRRHDDAAGRFLGLILLLSASMKGNR